MSDAVDWLMRLRRAFGSPNQLRLHGAVRVGSLLGPDVHLRRAGAGRATCPTSSRPAASSSGATTPRSRGWCTRRRPSAALARGARLVVVDPRDAGLAQQGGPWLRVRPGTDAALALSLAHVMIERGWFDAEFVRRWTNATLLVRADTGRLLRAADLTSAR